MEENSDFLKEGELSEFVYQKADGERSERRVLITQSPKPNYKGIDVTDLSPDQFVDLREAWNDYQMFLKDNVPSFEVWSGGWIGNFSNLKWRTFKPSGILKEDFPPIPTK